MQAPVYQWAFSDPRGVPAAVRAAYRADWTRATPADLRALIVASEFAATCLGGAYRVGPFFAHDALYLEPSSSSTPERAAAQLALARTWTLLAEQLESTTAPPLVTAPPGKSYTLAPALPRFTVEGSAAPVKFAPLGNSDAGFPPLLVAAFVVVATVQAGVVAYCAYKAAEVLDRELFRRENTRAMLKLHGAAVSLLDDHHARELAAGKTLTLDDGTRAALANLGAAQLAVAQRQEAPMGERESNLLLWAGAAVALLLLATHSAA